MSDAATADGAEVRLRRQRAGLADFGLYAFQAEDLDELLHEAAKLVSEALDVRMVKVLERRPDQGDFVVRAGVGWQPGVVGQAVIAGDSESPGGYSLKRREPVISPDLDRETRFRIPPLLTEHGVRSMVNVIIVGDREPFGVLEVDAPERRHFDDDDIAFLRNYANLLAAAVERLRNERALAALAEERRVLVRELQHRVKNILALVQSFAMLTSVEGRSAREFRDALIGRLHALARAHALFSERQNEDVDLAGLVERVVEPHRTERSDAVAIEGEPLTLDPKQGLTLSLILHELGTNAAKYGALSADGGRVRVWWLVENPEDGRRLRINWQETGGPRVVPPETKGFGTSMIERAAAYELDGRAEIAYRPEGLSCEIELPMAGQPSGQGG